MSQKGVVMLDNNGKIAFLQELRRRLVERDIWTRAYNGSEGCQYRLGGDTDGLECFIGLFIPDEKYKIELDYERYSIRALLWGAYIDFPGLAYSNDKSDICFLESIQTIHDGTNRIVGNSLPETVKSYWLSMIDFFIAALTANTPVPLEE